MSRGLRALVSGYYGFGNAGDEAILAGLIQGFRDLAPEIELTVLSGDPPSTTAEHAVVAVPRGLSSVRRSLGLSDLLISGGGGLLQDVTSWRSPLYYLAILEMARRARRPVAFIGQSLGPLRRPWVRALVRRALSGVHAVGLRDRPSLELFRQLGLSSPAEVTADLAFLLPAPTESAIEAARRRAGVDSGQFAVVALRPTPADAPGGQTAEHLASAIGGACEEIDLPAVVVAMQPSQDGPLARRVTAAMPKGLAREAPPMPARELLSLMAGSDLVVGMRLHALIFAALAGVPLVGITYDPKVDGLMDQLGLAPAASLAGLDADGLGRGIRETWQARDDLRQRLAARLPALRRAARRNIELTLEAARRN